MTPGEFIRTKRKEKGLTASAVAKQCGLTVTTISRLEHGDIRPPREHNIVKIAEAIGLEPDILLAKFRKAPQELVSLYCKNKRYRPLLRALDSLPEKDFDEIFDLVMDTVKKL